MILYIRDPKNSIRKFLEMIIKFINVVVYRINLYKSIPFLYQKRKHIEKKIKYLLLFTIASKKIKHLE